MEKINNDLDWFIQWIKQKEGEVNNSLWNEYVAEFIDEAFAEYQKEMREDEQTNAWVLYNKDCCYV